MIYFFIGTKAQLVKMAPLLAQVRDKGLAYRYIDSGQHPEGSRNILKMFDLPEPDIWLNDGKDLATVSTLIWWFLKLCFKCIFSPSWIRNNIFPEPGVCLIHGDTVTTLVGAFFAKRVGIKVAHVEAGLRSWSYTQPFPEEIVRVMCMHLSDLLFAPDKTAEENLKKMKVRAKVVQTGANTILDTIRMIKDMPVDVEIPDKPYLLLSCHRFELIYSKKRMTWLLDTIEMMAEKMLVVFPIHDPTRNRLKQYGLWDRLEGMANVKILPPQKFSDFVALERNAQFVGADGGSIQEETCYMGIPCLIFRDRTERGEGLKNTAVLAGFDREKVRKFLSEYKQLKGDASLFEDVYPVRRIVEELEGF